MRVAARLLAAALADICLTPNICPASCPQQLSCRLEPAELRLEPPTAEQFHADLQALFATGAPFHLHFALPGIGLFWCPSGGTLPLVKRASWQALLALSAKLTPALCLALRWPLSPGIQRRVEQEHEVVALPRTVFVRRQHHGLCDRFE